MYLEAKLHAVPVTMVIWTLTGWLTCYLVAVGCGHVDPLLPLISMCGIRWPESSIFSLFMNGSALLSGFCSYFRFRQVQHYQTRSTNIKHIWKLNVISLFFALISSVGLIIVANFQESYSPYRVVYFAHLVGALVTFSGGITSSGLQAALTRLMHPEIVDMKQFWIRLWIAIFGVAFYATAMTCGILGHVEREIPANLSSTEQKFTWDPTSPTYRLDLAFAACEWGVGLCFVGYFATLIPDFKRFKLRHNFESTHRSLRSDAEIDESSRNLLSRNSSVRSNRDDQ